MGQGRRARLEAAYREAIYEVDTASPPQLFRPGVGVPAGTPTFAFVTAWDPGGAVRDLAVNLAADAELVAELRVRGLSFVTGRARDVDGGHLEPSYAVFGIGRDEAAGLARAYGQAAIGWCDGGMFSVVWCDEGAPGGGT